MRIFHWAALAATIAGPALAEDSVTDGGALFVSQCTECHGVRSLAPFVPVSVEALRVSHPSKHGTLTGTDAELQAILDWLRSQ